MLVGINRTYAYELDVRGVHNLYKKLPTATKSVEYNRGNGNDTSNIRRRFAQCDAFVIVLALEYSVQSPHLTGSNCSQAVEA